MKKHIPVLFVLCAFLFSCASGPADQQKWGYEKDAVILHLQADPKLNFKDKKAHALMLCVYQLMSPNAFNQLAGSQAIGVGGDVHQAISARQGKDQVALKKNGGC